MMCASHLSASFFSFSKHQASMAVEIVHPWCENEELRRVMAVTPETSRFQWLNLSSTSVDQEAAGDWLVHNFETNTEPA